MPRFTRIEELTPSPSQEFVHVRIVRSRSHHGGPQLSGRDLRACPEVTRSDVYRRPRVDSDGLIADIGALTQLLRQVLEPLNYRNLDEVPEFSGKNTTTEFLAKTIYDRARGRILEGALGPDAGRGFHSLRVNLGESHVAWASYEGPVAQR